MLLWWQNKQIRIIKIINCICIIALLLFFKPDFYAPPFLEFVLCTYAKMCIQYHHLLQCRPIEPFNSIGFEMTTIQTKWVTINVICRIGYCITFWPRSNWAWFLPAHNEKFADDKNSYGWKETYYTYPM